MATEYTVLQMKDYGEDLGTRALGERVRMQILHALRGSSGNVLLDFAGVRLMTQSFGDEVFRKLVAEVGEAEVRRIRVSNISDDVRAVLRYSTPRTAQPA